MTPADVVHRQMVAYNDGNVDEFAQCYDEQAVVSRFTDRKPLAKGRDEIRDHYGELFELVPDLYSEVINQLVAGSFVVCHERVTGIETPVEALAVYLVEGDLIQRLWLGEEQ